MKRFVAFCFAALLATGIAQAQCGGGGHAMAGCDHQAMGAQHEQMMKNMQADLDAMKANLQKMKDLLGKTKDASAKEQLQLNINMWQSVLDNMDKHLQMMKGMHEQGMGMGMGPGHMHAMGEHGMSGCCGGGKDGGMACGKGDGQMFCCAGGKPAGPPPAKGEAPEKPKQ